MPEKSKSTLPFEFHGEHHSVAQGRIVDDTTAQFFGLSPAANSRLAWAQSRVFPLKLKPRDGDNSRDDNHLNDVTPSTDREPDFSFAVVTSAFRARIGTWFKKAVNSGKD